MFRNIKLVFKYLRHVFAIDKSYFIISIITRPDKCHAHIDAESPQNGD